MTTFTKEQLIEMIKRNITVMDRYPDLVTAQMDLEVYKIALASLEAEPVAYIFKHPAGKLFWALTDESNKEQADVIPVYAAAPASVVPDNASEPLAYAYKELTPEIMRNHLAVFERYGIAPNDSSTTIQALRIALDGIERSDAMLQSGNFRENKNSPTNNFREIAETSTNYPVIPSEVLSAIQKVAKIRADFDDFDGDRRGIGDCLDEAEQELIVTINKYASQLAAEPIAPNDVREQTAIPQVPVTPDGWISCSDRMPVIGELNWRTSFPLLVTCEIGVIPAYYGFVRVNGNKHYGFMESLKYGDDNGNHPQTNEYGLISNVTHWMPLPEPPQEVK
ncbi:hypothetical protein BT09F20_01980 [Escherichia coli]|nr:DUF551 domain-containing protein [Escherichia coli]ELS5789683.1 DUF551 domain-containing protein [Escherichia coli]